MIKLHSDEAYQKLLARVAELEAALTDIQNVGSRHSDEMVAVGFCVMCAKMALEQPPAQPGTDGGAGEGSDGTD